jgi:hypothetical protein
VLNDRREGVGATPSATFGGLSRYNRLKRPLVELRTGSRGADRVAGGLRAADPSWTPPAPARRRPPGAGTHPFPKGR